MKPRNFLPSIFVSVAVFVATPNLARASWPWSTGGTCALKLLHQPDTAIAKFGEAWGEALKKCDEGRCNANVRLIAKVLIAAGAAPEDITYLLIYPNEIRERLYPQAAVAQSAVGWRFHAVVYFRGFIFDADARQKIQGLGEYLGTMFGSENIPFETISVKRISWRDYERGFQERNIFNYAYHIANEYLKSETLAAFIQRELGLSAPPPQREITSDGVTHTGWAASNYLAAKEFFNRQPAYKNVQFKHLRGSPTAPDEVEHFNVVGQVVEVKAHSVRVVTAYDAMEVPFELIFDNSLVGAR